MLELRYKKSSLLSSDETLVEWF